MERNQKTDGSFGTTSSSSRSRRRRRGGNQSSVTTPTPISPTQSTGDNSTGGLGSSSYTYPEGATSQSVITTQPGSTGGTSSGGNLTAAVLGASSLASTLVAAVTGVTNNGSTGGAITSAIGGAIGNGTSDPVTVAATSALTSAATAAAATTPSSGVINHCLQGFVVFGFGIGSFVCGASLVSKLSDCCLGNRQADGGPEDIELEEIYTPPNNGGNRTSVRQALLNGRGVGPSSSNHLTPGNNGPNPVLVFPPSYYQTR